MYYKNTLMVEQIIIVQNISFIKSNVLYRGEFPRSAGKYE